MWACKSVGTYRPKNGSLNCRCRTLCLGSILYSNYCITLTLTFSYNETSPYITCTQATSGIVAGGGLQVA